MDKYNLVYDFRSEVVNPLWIIPAALCMILLYYIVIKRRPLFNQKLYTVLILACVGSPFGLYIFVRNLIENNAIKTMMDGSKYSIVEGEIMGYEMYAQKGKAEGFTLNGTPFYYSRYEVISGFHNTNPERRLIKGNGQYVRIGYYSKPKEGDFPRNYIVLIEELK